MLPAQLKEWRKKLGLTQEEAGLRLGVSRVAEQNWENGGTPIPKAVEAAIETIEMEWKRRPEFGPVWLAFSERSNRRPDHGIGRLATMQRKSFPNNDTAIRWASEMWGRADFQNPFIQDEQGNSIWNLPRLRAAVEERRAEKGNDSMELIAKLNAIADHFSSLPVLDDRAADEIIGYNEHGHFD